MQYLSGRIAAAALAGTFALTASAAGAKDKVFGLAVPSLGFSYLVSASDGFSEAAKKVGAKTVTLDSKFNVEKMGNDIDDLAAQHVDGVGIMPLDGVVAQSWVDKLNDAGIISDAGGSQVGDPVKRSLYDVYPGLVALVSTDDIKMGEMSAEMAANQLPAGRKAKIAIIEGAPGFAVVQQRKQGFLAGLAKANANYEIVASQPTNWSPEKGAEVCQNILTATPDLDLIFSEADDMAVGCAKAIKATQSKAVLISTAGGSKFGNDAIADGSIFGSICTRPKLIGQKMFEELWAASNAPAKPKAHFVTYELKAITKANLADCVPEW
jgi:ribose transport system substrate-binding protein